MREVTEDCKSQQLKALMQEHNKAVEFMEALKKRFPELPAVPNKIVLKGRMNSGKGNP